MKQEDDLPRSNASPASLILFAASAILFLATLYLLTGLPLIICG